MKKYFEKTSIALIIAMMFILAIFGGEAMKTHTIDDTAKYKMVVNAQGVKTEKETRTTTQVELGNYISLGKYNGKDIVWRCVSVDDHGSLMLADNVIDTLPYDAKTNDNNRSKSHSRNYKRDTYGSNYWKDSNMRSWLNSTADAGKVKWLCGNPPKADYVDGNAYDQKAGFLNDFSKAEIAAMKTVTQRSLVSHPEYKHGFYDGDGRSDLEYNYYIDSVASNFNSAYGENSTEKVFLLDVQQVNAVWKNFDDYYIGKNEQGSGWPYWLRTPVSNCNHDMRYVHNNGSVGRESPHRSYIGVRPAFYLDTEYYVATFGNGTKANPYIGSAPDKVESDYTVAEPEDDPNQEWDINIEQKLELTLGPYYTSDGKYAEPIIPVYTIQKTRSDTENMVILICGEGYTKSQQQKFINDVKKVWRGAMQYEPYRSYADRFNVYALCTASESSFENGGSTFFDVVVSNKPSAAISTNMGNAWKNHIFERCIGPTFIEQIHDAHIPNNTEPDVFKWNDDEQYPPFYYVHNYINQFALLVNTSRNFGDNYTNLPYGFHYFITPADSDRAAKTFTHELGHGLLGLGDEYMSSTTQQTDLTSLNVAHTHDPNNVKWKQLLGFRKTYTCNALGYGNSYNSSFECLMRDTNFTFCEVCKLQGYKRLSQLVSGKSLYVADPEVKKYTGQYSSYSDFVDTTYTGYYNFANYRSGVVLSGADKNKFNTSMAGKKIELRTIIQNLSDVTERYVTMKVWIKRADGSVGTTVGGQRLEATQTFTIPVWSEKSKFWAKGALEYKGSDFNSGLASCSLIYQIPDDAVLYDGDTVAFEVTDENGNVLANDGTETQTYANVNIEYKFEDGSDIPNAPQAVIPVPVGTTLDWTAPPTLLGHTFIRAEGQNGTVNGSGQTVTYYYSKQSNVHIHDWGDWVSGGNGTHTRTCRTDNSHSETANCVGGTATCTTKAVCDVCKTTYGETAPHSTTQYGGKDDTGHWDTCSTCDNIFNFEAHTPDREKADETNPVKCMKCDFVITPAEGETDTRIVITDKLVPVTELVKVYVEEETQEPTFGGILVRGIDYEVEYAKKEGGSLTFGGIPIGAGTYIVTVTGKGTYSGSFTKEFVINKAEQSAPVGLFANPISCKEGLGTIIGVTTAMEYRKVGDADFTACTSTTITGLVAGEYEIRYKEDDNYLAGAVTKVSVVINHNFGVIVERQEPSCSATGTEAHYYCSRCEKYFDESKNEKTFEELTIPINPEKHNFSDLVKEKPATCNEGGMKAHYKCVECGKYFDENKNETTEEALKTPVSPYYGHNFGFWVEEEYATCQAPGRKGYKHCSICNKDYDASNTEITDFVIPVNPDGHELGDLVAEVPATCKDTGVKEHRDCRLCGKHCDPITRKEIADLTIPTTNNHTYGELIPEVPATADKTGTKKHHKCSVCGKLFDENKNEVTAADLVIPKIGTHKVTVTGGTGGGVFEEGASVTITANAPATGKKFSGWTIDGITGLDTTKTSLTFNMPAGNVTATANYEDIEYTITVNGGTVDKAKAIYGERVTITANAPATGKEFDKWVVSGITLTDEDLAKSTVTFGMPANDVTFTATYKDVVYQVTVENGTTTLDMATYQTEVTVTANAPDADEYFDKWEVTGITLSDEDLAKSTLTFNMPAGNVTFKATYLRVTKYGIVIVDGTKDKEVAKAGETVTITANPAPTGKVFDKWTCETAGVTIEFESATSSPTTFIMPASNVKIQAHFRDIEAAPSIEIKVEGGTGAGTYKEGDEVTVTAEDKEDKVFKCWKDESGEIVSTEKSYKFTVSAEKTLTAVYEDKSSGGGEITPPAKKDGLSGGQIAGIVIGSVAVVGIGGFAIFWFAVKKKTFADLGVALKKGFTAIGNFFKNLGAKIKALFTKKK